MCSLKYTKDQGSGYGEEEFSVKRQTNINENKLAVSNFTNSFNSEIVF